MHALPRTRPCVWVRHALPLVNLGLEAALRGHRELEVCESVAGAAACSENESEAERRPPAPASPVDVVVLDHAAGLCLAAAQKASRAPVALARARLLVVTASDREQDVRRALAAGVHGYLLHDCSPEELGDAVQVLARGGRHLCPAAAQRMAESLTYEALTPRELQVLRLLVAGHANKVIAGHLALSVGTVKAHLKHVLAKLGAQSRTQAIGVAVQRGLVATAAADAKDAIACEPAGPRLRLARGRPAQRPASPTALRRA